MLFSKMTDVVLNAVATRKDGVQIMVAIGKWTALMIGSIVVMLEKDSQSSLQVIDRFTESMKKEMKAHAIMIRGLKRTAEGKDPEESRIILPKGIKR